MASFPQDRALTVPATTDVCDAHEARFDDGSLQVVALPWRAFGRRRAFAGRVETLRCFEDNAQVREQLQRPGEGRVLVVDGGGSLRRALVGGQLGLLAERNGWAAVVVHGAVRDADELDACDVAVRALGTTPRRSDKRGAGQAGVVLEFGGARLAPGDWICGDADGVIVAREPLAP